MFFLFAFDKLLGAVIFDLLTASCGGGRSRGDRCSSSDLSGVWLRFFGSKCTCALFGFERLSSRSICV
ncbi:hypothetical protein V6Z12_D02G183900 [Gossypium hirsutum]